MRQNRWVIVLRSIMAALMLALGIASLAAGRIVVGVLFVALATTNVALTLTMRRRRAELLKRFPGLARGSAPPTAEPASPQ